MAVAPKVGLRFPGLARGAPGVISLSTSIIGYQLFRDGDDFCVSTSDAAYRKGPDNVLIVRAERDISQGDLKDVANFLSGIVPDEFEIYREKSKENYLIEFNDGDLNSIVYGKLLQLIYLYRNDVPKYLLENIIPLMRDEFKASHVLPIVCRCEYFQGWIGFLKSAFITSRYGRERSAGLVLEKGAFDGILPNTFAPLSYVDALTRQLPYAMTLPVDRDGCSWHFMTDGMWAFPHVKTEGVFQQFMHDLNPVGNSPSMLGFDGIKNMSRMNIIKFIKILCGKINKGADIDKGISLWMSDGWQQA